ncbi:hypothetical protein DTL21_19815 [Bremerella cremea]|uniref:DUF4350 domain-containing protein n=1 Tax=Blastopirellula marina TaxID=124 RepID=A0A2S8FJW7_9BACT|nr:MULTISPECIES: hypothetical protein [Pirellulaceae]PQO32462.1 hypothetical protein C5Y83_19795 [Blastopirellula marina]RCS45529.1 hypothetical protein DTL21_19815 [Bremerella cremea]
MLRSTNLLLGVLALTCCLLFSGCGTKSTQLPTAYGKRSGNSAASVNGTKVLSEMFREAGYWVSSYSAVSPNLLRHDVIVWVPNSFEGPNAEFRDVILRWLDEEDGRTFIYVGRDFDASVQYWDDVLSKVPPAQKLDAMRQRSLAIQQFDELRNFTPEEADFYFYKTERDVPRRVAKSLRGPWSKGIDSSKTNIVLRTKMLPATTDSLYEDYDVDEEDEAPVYIVEDIEVLLSSQGEAIVTRMGSEYSDSQLILVNNGSFLLNLPLVNPEHRKLAGKLVNQCDQAYYSPETVAFLETDQVVDIRQADDATDGTSGWEWLTKWPLNLVGLQMAWWMIVLCFALYPIFGRPKQLPSAETSDFKKHIDSVGDLLEATDDYGYAQLRLQQYQQIMKGDAVYRRSKTRRGDGK